MYSFFVLGLIPGTSFQITFQQWLDCLLLVVDMVGVLWLYRRHETVMAPYLQATATLTLAHDLGNNAYHQVQRQLKVFLEAQLASWQEL
jgi:hypothetical protein